VPTYEYKAVHEDGRDAVGLLNADTARDARDRLRAQRLLVVNIRPVEDAAADAAPRRRLAFPARRNVGEIALITRQLATLLKAGIPLSEALTALVQQVERESMEKVLRDVREKVLEGMPLGDALARHPVHFDTLYVSMVKAGEASGTLDLILRRLADFTQRQARVANRVQAALVYPCLIAAVAASVVCFLMTFVVPKIALVVKAQKGELPWITQSLISASHFLRQDWLFLLGGLAALGLAVMAALETDRGRMFRDRLSLRLPIVGDLLKKQIIARFAATLSTLLASGLPALDALRIVGQVLSNRVLSDTVNRVHDRIVEGADISTPLKESGIFPPVVGYMIAVGEESGQLESILNTLSEAYEEEVEVSTQKLLSVLEPIMIVVMALVVGYIVLAILLPILNMVDTMKHR